MVLWIVVALVTGFGQAVTAQTGRFSRGTGNDPTYHSFVIPLDAELGTTNTPLLTTTLAAMGGLSRLYHVDATNTGSSAFITNRIAFTNAVAAFGQKYAGSPLYLGQTYHFGVYAGNPDYIIQSRTNAFLITWVNKSTGAYSNAGVYTIRSLRRLTVGPVF